MPPKLTVLDPTGSPPEAPGLSLAPRLPGLDGKLVYLVDCRFEDADRFFEQMRQWFADNLPRVETRLVHWRRRGFEDDPETLAEIAADGDAAILGVGI